MCWESYKENKPTAKQMEKFLSSSIEILKNELNCMLEYRELDDKLVMNISKTLDTLIFEYHKIRH